MSKSVSVLLGLAALVVSGCAVLDRDVNADSIALPAGLKRAIVQTNPFALTIFSRISDPRQPVTIYIEGDGLAWLSRTEVSMDPTPREALGLQLASVDPSANLAYIARPCQYTPQEKNPACGPRYWTGARFAPEVIASVSQAVDQVAAQAPGQKVNLVGYSGGGAVAVLVAARRQDVASIRSVAGNLDHAAVSRHNGVSLLFDSLNAIDVADKVAEVPQIHFAGAADAIVPPGIAERYRDASASSCVTVRTVSGVRHETGWRERWRELVKDVPRCGG